MSSTKTGKERNASRFELPAELWTQIFDLAIDEDVLFQYALPSAMAESAWFRTVHGDWAIRTPPEALSLIQRRSYETKKAIVSTCRAWHRLGSEFLYRCLYFEDPAKLQPLCAVLDADSSLGWWAKRIHVAHYHAGSGLAIEDVEIALISVIRHCPNLEIFIVDWPMGNAFGPVADALATYNSKSLRTVHWHAPCEATPKVIWALASLPLVVSAHIEFDAPKSETLHLGSASDVRLTLPNLQQLSLFGYFEEFLEQVDGWSIPALKSFSYDCGASQFEQPDIVPFLTHHGASLIFLNLLCIPPLDVAKILELCPLLRTLTFDADWRLPSPDNDSLETITTIVNRPHENITHIGCHGLGHAFGVGFVANRAAIEPLRSNMIRRANEKNFAALNRMNFPSLKCIRVLSCTLLSDLNACNGPDNSCFGRWERWWNQCTNQGIRLEDCTGNALGYLPENSNYDEDGDADQEETDGSYEEEDEEDSFEIEEDEGGVRFRFVIPPQPEESPLSELKQLLEECRKMSAEREEEFMVPPLGWR